MAWPPRKRNLLKILFADEKNAGGPDEYQAMARRLIGKLRVDYSQFPGDPGLEALVAELSDDYPLFRELWKSPDLQARSEGISVRQHATHGPIRLEHSSYMPEGAQTLRVVIFAPCDKASENALASIAGSLG